MSLSSYLPPLPKVTQETIAVLAATIIVAWLISKSPRLRELVRGNQLPSPLNQ
jgi:hypothetical protein